MGSCLLHFGMHKAGSTSIQSALFRCLADEQFYFIDLGLSNCSPCVATAFMLNPMKYQSNERLGKESRRVLSEKTFIRDQLAEQLAIAGKRTAILSAEVICRFKETELQNLCQFINDTGFNVAAVGYIRPPYSYMNSSYQQRLKAGSDLRTLDLTKLYPSYRIRFEKFEKVLGQKNVRFWPFKPELFPAQYVVHEFCERLGISIDLSKVVPENQSISVLAVALLFAYRKYGPGYGCGPNVERENKLLVRRLSTVHGAPFRLHSSVVRPVLDANAEDIAWMEFRLQTSLKEELSSNVDETIIDEIGLLAKLPLAVGWLIQELGMHFPGMRLDPCEFSPPIVAMLMHELRLRIFRTCSPLPKPHTSTEETHEGHCRNCCKKTSYCAGQPKNWAVRKLRGMALRAKSKA